MAHFIQSLPKILRFLLPIFIIVFWFYWRFLQTLIAMHKKTFCTFCKKEKLIFVANSYYSPFHSHLILSTEGSYSVHWCSVHCALVQPLAIKRKQLGS